MFQEACCLHVVGVHQHIGSGIREVERFGQAMRVLSRRLYKLTKSSQDATDELAYVVEIVRDGFAFAIGRRTMPEMLDYSVVAAITGDAQGNVAGLKLKNVKTGAESVLPVKGIFVAIGHIPNTGPFAPPLGAPSVRPLGLWLVGTMPMRKPTTLPLLQKGRTTSAVDINQYKQQSTI